MTMVAANLSRAKRWIPPGFPMRPVNIQDQSNGAKKHQNWMLSGLLALHLFAK